MMDQTVKIIVDSRVGKQVAIIRDEIAIILLRHRMKDVGEEKKEDNGN